MEYWNYVCWLVHNICLTSIYPVLSCDSFNFASQHPLTIYSWKLPFSESMFLSSHFFKNLFCSFRKSTEELSRKLFILYGWNSYEHSEGKYLLFHRLLIRFLCNSLHLHFFASPLEKFSLSTAYMFHFWEIGCWSYLVTNVTCLWFIVGCIQVSASNWWWYWPGAWVCL